MWGQLFSERSECITDLKCVTRVIVTQNNSADEIGTRQAQAAVLRSGKAASSSSPGPRPSCRPNSLPAPTRVAARSPHRTAPRRTRRPPDRPNPRPGATTPRTPAGPAQRTAYSRKTDRLREAHGAMPAAAGRGRPAATRCQPAAHSPSGLSAGWGTPPLRAAPHAKGLFPYALHLPSFTLKPLPFMQSHTHGPGRPASSLCAAFSLTASAGPPRGPAPL